MTSAPDLINGGFELVGALFTWRNFLQLRRDRTIAGVYWPTTAFMVAWGLWNLVYYPSLAQWASFIGGVLLVAGNVAWVALAIRIMRADGTLPAWLKQLLCRHRDWHVEGFRWDGGFDECCSGCGRTRKMRP